MSWRTIVSAAVCALVAGPAMAQDKTIKIGFISTFSGPAAAIGNDMKNSFERLKYGNNHIPIQNPDGSYSLHTVATIVKDDQDRFHDQCPMK
jgi:hypothetical protein